MKILFLLLTVCSVTVFARTDEELWSDFKTKFDKFYITPENDALHFSTFRENLRKIEEHNAKFEKKQTSFFMGINKFSDLTHEEFKELNKRYSPKLKRNVRKFRDVSLADTLPDSVDWREKGAVNDVRDEGSCWGGSYAFGLVGTVEGKVFLKYGKLLKLSPQMLLDCSFMFGNITCDQIGDSRAGLNYMASQGIALDEDYPFVGVQSNGKCMMNESLRADVHVRDYIDIFPRENYLQNAVAANGPIFVEINSDWLQNYAGGIYDGTCSDVPTNTGMLLVGYGTENGVDYWIIKNSWGTDWGEQGYIKLKRIGAFGMCGITANAVYPWLW